MKHKMFFKLSAICLVAVSMLISCTKDYGSDIQSLQDKVDALTSQVATLQKTIDDGSVITSVAAIADGVKVTLSNNESFEIKNGKNGKDGANGTNGTNGTNGKDGKDGKDGSVVTIGNNGNWFIDGNDTGKASKGADGKNGENGKDGKNGDYYVPCTDQSSANYGFWEKVDGTTGAKTVTTEQWLPEGTLTAVWDEDAETLTIHNVEGAEDGIVEISLTNDLKSLAFIPTTWDAYMGLPVIQSYAVVNPAMWTWAYFSSNATAVNWEGNEDWATSTRFKAWDGQNVISHDRSHIGFMSPNLASRIMLCTLLAQEGMKDDPMYDEYWDATSPNMFCNANYTGFRFNTYYLQDWPEGRYMDVTFTVEQMKEWVVETLNKLGLCYLGQGSSANAWFTDARVATTGYEAAYRVNPGTANLDGYKYSMIARSVDVIDTKADGDLEYACPLSCKAKYNGKDQIEVSGAVDFYKYQATTPLEFLKFLCACTSFGDTYSGDGMYSGDPGHPDFGTGNYYEKHVGFKYLSEYMQLAGVDKRALVALKATRGKNETVVSDYATVHMDYLMPMWTAYTMDKQGMTPINWKPANTLYGKYYGESFFPEDFNDTMLINDVYDVPAHMRYADPTFGALEDLGFDVAYDWQLFPGSLYEQVGYYGETKGCGEYCQITKDGKVSVQDAYKQPDQMKNVIGKVCSVFVNVTVNGIGYSPDPAFYHILILPDMKDCANAVYDLGNYNYSTLAQEFTAPVQPLLDSLHIDNAVFSEVYELTNSTTETGYSATVTVGNTNNFVAGSISNATLLGEHSVTYTFTPKDGYKTFKPCTYTVKYNVVNDFPALVLNPDYVLYTDADRTVLDVSDAWDDVDTILVVKGKRNPANTNNWIPQSSIKEHLKDYEAYADVNNYTNLSMKLTEARNGSNPAATILATDETPYDVQEILLNGGYSDWANGYKDFVISAFADLANGQEVLVKEYIIRFVCPFVVKCADVILHTHTKDYCEAHADVKVVEYGTEKVLVSYNVAVGSFTAVVSSYAQETYPSIFSGSALLPDYELFADKSFNAYPEWGDNLYGGNSKVTNAKQFGPWFYWNNDGTDLQTNKTCYYKATVTLNGSYGKISGKGNVIVLSTANSAAAHVDHETSGYIRPTYRPEELGDLPGSPSGAYDSIFE